MATVTGANALAGEANLTFSDGKNLGVGTASPNSFSGYSTVTIGGSNSTTGSGLDFENNSGTILARLFGDASGSQYGTVAGGSHRFEVDGTEKIRFLSTGGITFNGDTATTNALDDYEEGTWTPNWITEGSGGGTVTGVSTNIASYVKVGNQVTLNWYGNVQTSGTAYGYQITNLPFTQKAMAGGSGGAAGCGVSISTGGTWWIQGSQNTANVYLKKYDDSWVPNPAVQAAFTYTID